MTTFSDQLNEQIGNELAAHTMYVSVATYFESLTMPQMAAFFYSQANEERDHAMMMVQFQLDTDIQPKIPAVAAPQADFSDVVEPIQLALENERNVTKQINNLLRIAREEDNYAAEQFMQWFVKEQVEEVATMSDLLAVVERNKDSLETVEEYVDREQRPGDSDPTAPRIAGA